MSLQLVKLAFYQPVKSKVPKKDGEDVWKSDPSAKLLLVAMCFLTTTGKVWAERHTLMQMTGLSERTLFRKIRCLVEQGLLIQDDVNKFQIAAKLVTKLAVNPAKLVTKLAVNPAKLAGPYKENSNNGNITEPDTLSSKDVYPIESLQKHIWRRMQNHPGDPGATPEADEDSSERADWWSLLDKRKKLDAQLENLIK
jgi:hypothetical protein